MQRTFAFRSVLCLIFAALPLAAQNASLVGTVKDQQGGVIPNATVTLTSQDTGVSQTTVADSERQLRISHGTSRRLHSSRSSKRAFRPSPRPGSSSRLTTGRRLDLVHAGGRHHTVVTVESQTATVSTESSTLGSVVENKKIVEIPLNGRFFLDLALLQTGTVVPSTNNRTFLAAPSGIGISGINASGTREDSTNYVVDGINLSDMVQNQITFQPNIDMIQEFKVQTNAFSAEYGRNAGIIINGVSKSGTNGVHGTAYEFVRNDHFDAKNFFDPAGKIAPFKRNIFGYSVGGPIIKNKTFFFHSYEGRRGREVATMNTVVPTPAQRAAVTNPVIQKLLGLDAGGQRCHRHALRRLRRAPAHAESGDRPHRSQLQREELPVRQLHHQPRRAHRADAAEQQSAGLRRRAVPAKRYLISLGYIHVFSPTLTNEFHAGLNRVRIDFHQAFTGNPADYGMTTPSSVMPRDRSGQRRTAAIRGSAASPASRRDAATPRSSIPIPWPGSAAGIPSSSAPNSAASATTTSMAAPAASSCSPRWPPSWPRRRRRPSRRRSR